MPDIVIALYVATRATAHSMLLVSFIICAVPGLSPATTTVLPHKLEHRHQIGNSGRISGHHHGQCAGLGAPTPALIGTSMTVTSAPLHSASISRTKGTPTVQVLTSVFMAFPANKPSGLESAQPKNL